MTPDPLQQHYASDGQQETPTPATFHYEPPTLIALGNVARGASQTCGPGSTPQSGCGVGGSAHALCGAGTAPGAVCKSGGIAQGACKSGGQPNT